MPPLARPCPPQTGSPLVFSRVLLPTFWDGDSHSHSHNHSDIPGSIFTAAVVHALARLSQMGSAVGALVPIASPSLAPPGLTRSCACTAPGYSGSRSSWVADPREQRGVEWLLPAGARDTQRSLCLSVGLRSSCSRASGCHLPGFRLVFPRQGLQGHVAPGVFGVEG